MEKPTAELGECDGRIQIPATDQRKDWNPFGDDYDDSEAGMQLAQQLLHISRYQPVSGL